MFMIKKILMVMLGLIVLAAVVTTVHLPSRHFVLRWYDGIMLYKQLETNYQEEPACQSEDKIRSCISNILKKTDGFRYGSDIGFGIAVLMNKNLSYDAFLQGNAVLVGAIDPEKFKIRKIKGKTAKRIFRNEKKTLVDALTENKLQMENSIKERRFPASIDDQTILLRALEEKIAELSK